MLNLLLKSQKPKLVTKDLQYVRLPTIDSQENKKKKIVQHHLKLLQIHLQETWLMYPRKTLTLKNVSIIFF